MEKIKVLVADDHPTFREGLCRFMDEQEDLQVVARTADGEEAVRLAKKVLPDVAIIDVAMPKLSGIEAARQIKAACPRTAVVMLSAYDYESYLVASLQAGAVGYLLKTAGVSELISAIRLVHAGEAVFHLGAMSKTLGRLSSENGQGERALGRLQSRELEVLRQAAKGMSNKAIAMELVISERTVQTHMLNIFRKLGVGSRTEAVLRALSEGWLTPADLPRKGSA